jgi:hypothetical protein
LKSNKLLTNVASQTLGRTIDWRTHIPLLLPKKKKNSEDADKKSAISAPSGMVICA